MTSSASRRRCAASSSTAAPVDLRLLALGGYVDREHEPRDAEAFSAWDETKPGTPQTVPIPDDLPPGELA